MSRIKVDEVNNLYATLKNYALTDLSVVGAYTQLLLAMNAENLTDEQQKYLEKIFRHNLRSIEYWHVLGNSLRLNEDEVVTKWISQSLSEVVNSAISSLEKMIDFIDLEVKIDENLPQIRGCREIETLFRSLLYPRSQSEKFILIRAGLINDSQIQVHAFQEWEYPFEKEHLEDRLFYLGSHLLIAKLIVERLYNKTMSLHPIEKGVELRFSLPIWQLNSMVPLEVNITEKNNGGKLTLFLGQDLTVTFSNLNNWESCELVDYNSDVLVCAERGVQGRTKNVRYRFWTFREGQTNLTFQYRPADSTDLKNFSIHVEVHA